MLKSVFFGSVVAATMTVGALLLFLPTPVPGDEPLEGEEKSEVLNATEITFAENSFTITGVSVFDGRALQHDMNVIVRDGVISAIGENIEVPENMSVENGNGKTLIPGLIDAHTHSWAAALTEALQFGVTTNIDMFTMPAFLNSTIKARESNGRSIEAQLYSAGMLATAPEGHGTQFGTPVETLTAPEQAQAWVDARLSEGSDFIKIVYNPYINYLPSINREIAKAVIEAAHKRDVLVVAHISTLREAQDVVEDGIDGLVHIFADQPVTQEFVDLAVRENIFIIPTLAITASADGNTYGQDYAKKKNVEQWLYPSQGQTLQAVFPQGGIEGFDIDVAIENVRVLHNAGVPIFAGSDAPNPGTAHGVSVHNEMALLVKAGMTPIEALQAATSGPANAFDIPAGYLKVGARADMVLLDSDPASSIEATLAINKIYRNGYALERNLITQTVSSKTVDNSDLGTFEDSIRTPQGFTWSTTTDEIATGKSVATVERGEPGADGSAGALKVSASVNTGFPFPWAGAALFMSTDFTSGYSIEAYDSINFAMRGTPGTYRIMMFNAGFSGNPPTLTFDVTQNWQEFKFPLEDFPGLAANSIAGLGIVAGPQYGQYEYEIDNVSLAK